MVYDDLMLIAHIAHIALRSFGRPERHPQISWQHCGWARGVFADWSCGLALKVGWRNGLLV